MSRPSTKKTSKPAKKATKPAKELAITAYVVVRDLLGEVPAHSEPERVFASKAAAAKFAQERNRDLQRLCNPFEDHDPDYLLKKGEKAFIAVVKQLGLKVPAKEKGSYAYIDWKAWWDRSYFDMTEEQREAIWGALDKYNWYRVKATTVLS